jgi:hypothetical protein
VPPGRATEQRATAPAQRATAWGDPAGVDLGGTWDQHGNYWYTDENTGSNWVWQEPQKQWTQLSTPADAIHVQGRAPGGQGVNPYVAFNQGIGTRWGQTHGLFLGIGAAPIAEPMAFVGEKGAVVVGSLVPGGQGFLLAGPPLAHARKEMTAIRERWEEEAKQRDREWEILQAEGRGDLYRVPLVVGATAPEGPAGKTPARVQDFVDRITDTYRTEITKARARLPNASASEIGRVAEKATLEQVEPLARAAGLDPGHIWVGDFPVGVTGPKGGASTAEMGSQKYGFIVELKKSPRAVRGYQADAHRVAVEEAVNFEKGGAYYRVYGENYEGEGVDTYKMGEPQVEAEPEITVEAVP